MTNANDTTNVTGDGSLSENPSVVNTPTTMMFGQIPVTLGQDSMAATAGNGPAGLVQPMASMAMNGSSGSVARVPAVIPAEKPEKFTGLNFKRWQQKMLFYLTTLGLARFLTEDPPTPREDETDRDVLMTFSAWKDSDYLCRNSVMNSLNDSLYNVYSSKRSSKELWESLDRKYKTEDAGSKKYIVGRFLDFQMVDSKAVVSQVQELQLISSTRFMPRG